MARRPSPAHGCLAVLTAAAAAAVLCAAGPAAALPQPQHLQVPQRQMPCCLRVTPFHVQALQQRMFQRFQALEVRAQDLRGVFGAFQAAQGNATRRLRFLESEHARLGEEVARLDSRVQSLEALQRRAANDYRRLQYFPRARRQATQLKEAPPRGDFVTKMRFHTSARDAGETRSGVDSVRQSYVDTRSNDNVRSSSNEIEEKASVETFPYVKLGIPSYSNVPAIGRTRGDLPRQSYVDARSYDVLSTQRALADKTYVDARSSSNTDYYDKAEQMAPPRPHFVTGMPSHTNVRSNSRRTLAKQSQVIGPAPSSSSSKTNFSNAADEEKRSNSNGATRGSLTEQWYDTASPRRRLVRAQTAPPEQLPHLFVHLDDASKDMELSADASGRMLQVPAHADNEVAPPGRAPEGSYGASPADRTPAIAAPGRPAPEGSFGALPATDYVPADAASGPAPPGNSGLSSSTSPAATHVNTSDPGHDHAPNIHASTHATPDHDHTLNTLADAPAAAQDHAATPTHDHPSNSSHHHTSNAHDATPGHDHIPNTYAANPSYDQASNTHAAPNIPTAVPNPNHAANSATTPTPLWKLEAAASEQLDVISAADEDADTESDAGEDAGAGGGGVSFWAPANASDPTLDDLFGGDAVRCSRQPGGDCSDTQSVHDGPRSESSDGPLPGQTSDAVASASNHGETVGQMENTAIVEDKFLPPGSDNRGESNTLRSEVRPEVNDSKVSEQDTNRSEFLSPGEATASQVNKFLTTGADEGAESNSSRDRSELRPVVNDSKVSGQDPNTSEFRSPEDITSSLVDKFLTGVDAGGDCGGGGGGGDCAAQLSDAELREALRELDALLQRPAAAAPPPDPEKALLKRALTLALAALERTSDACIGLVDATANAFEGLAARQA